MGCCESASQASTVLAAVLLFIGVLSIILACVYTSCMILSGDAGYCGVYKEATEVCYCVIGLIVFLWLITVVIEYRACVVKD